MSVINQMLDQLEQRGADAANEQFMVRAVRHPRRSYAMPLLATGLALLAGIAAWHWMSSHKPLPSAVGEPAATVAGAAPKAGDPQPAEARAEPAPQQAGSSPRPGAAEKLTPQNQSVATVATPVSAIPATAPESAFVPVSKMSLELSLKPLPSATRLSGKTQDGAHSRQVASANSGQGATGEKNALAAKLVPDIEPDKAMPAPPAPQRSIPPASANTKARASPGIVPMKQVSSAQRADAEFRRAAGLMQQGRIADAVAGYEAALRLDAGHDAARQALVALLLEDKRNADAEKVMLEGLRSKPENIGLTMLLARLQVERGALEQATATLEKSLRFADEQADYRAFLAALLQRQNRNEEAVAHYRIVLQHAPNNGIWQMGYGISLQSLQRNAEAKEAFKRALDTQTLSPELQAFVQAKIKEL